MTLTLAMICKNELDNLKRLKPLVEEHVDEWIVVMPPKDPAINWAKKNGIKVIVKDHTQEIEPEIREQMKEYKVNIPDDYRIFRFADARATSFSEATGTHILWLDADDHPHGIERLRELIEGSQADMFEAVYDYGKDYEGNSVSDHVRERVIKNNGKFHWLGSKLGLIHETIVPQDGYAPYIQTLDEKEFYVEHLSDHVGESSDRNFVALAYEYIKTQGEDPRTTYYLGTEYFNHKMYDMAIKIFLEYVKVGGWDEERFRAWIQIGEAYHQLGDLESGRNAYLNAQKELPHRPDSYLSLGESYFEDGDWAKAIEYFLTGMQKKLPQTKHSVDVTRYTFRPSVFIALSYLELGKPADAHDWYLRAKKLNPRHQWIAENASLFTEAKQLNDYVQSFVKLGQLSKQLYPKTLGKIADAIPDELMGQEILLDFRRRFSTPKVWPDNSIVYFCSSVMEDWGPDSLTTGCGGSEEAVIHLTKRWAKLGYDVTVFNNCPVEKTVDGVKWVRFERFNPRDIFNIIISWRSNAYLTPTVARKKLIDIHDVPDATFFTEESLKNVTVMAKSEYHRSLLPKVGDDFFQIVPNGIDMDQFTDLPEKVKNNLVWTSSYDRGLENLLEMWPAVIERVPDATLDIAYGFNLFDKTPFGKTSRGRDWKAKMIYLMGQKGITEHGRLPSNEVAKLYCKADVWAYPTAFPEIDCITATKAMAAKCVPITTDYAVLKERNQGVLISGDIADNKDKFQTELVELLKDEERKETIRNKLDVSHHDWDAIAKRWTENF